MSGHFVISLDFELLWGVRDHADKASYGTNILGAREAIPRILNLFSQNGIRATWAVVGFLFCEGKEHLLSVLPPPEKRPKYRNSNLSNYNYLNDVGRDELSDPYYFAPALISQIAATPGQEIGTHTLSHCYCLEDGFTQEAFEADLLVAQELAAHQHIKPRSIVFPRNQYAPEYLDICRRVGLTSFRGNPSRWAYRPTKSNNQTSLRRAVRLLDAHSGILGSLTTRPYMAQGLTNVPASRFLRPNSGRLGKLHPLHCNTIQRGMTGAARRNETYHLWWHRCASRRRVQSCCRSRGKKWCAAGDTGSSQARWTYSLCHGGDGQ